MRHRLFRRAMAVGALMLIACRDSLSDTAVAPVPDARATVQLAVMKSTAADSGTIAVELRASGVNTLDSKAVSVTAAIVYDTTRLVYVSDDSPGDGALRAVNAARGRVMVAAAHATGFTSDVYAKLRFVARDADAYRTMSLQLNELHLANATDMRAAITVLPLVVIK